MATLKITKVRSAIKRPQNQKRTLIALGLKKIGQVVEQEDTSAIRGMVRTVAHLVSVEESN